MKLAFSTLIFNLLISLSTQASLLSTGYGVNGNFQNNNFTTTEYKNGIATRQWLDLVVTNGISYNSILNDINDDGQLNVSASNFNANADAIKDIGSLDIGLTKGWRVASSQDVNQLLNDFFGITFNPNAGSYTFKDDDGFRSNPPIVQDFISLFGNTYYEGLEDVTPNTNNEFASNPSSAFSAGYTSLLSPFSFESFRVSSDALNTYSRTPSSQRYEIGTWLVRDIREVDSPIAIHLLVIACLYLLIRRGVRWNIS